jgi:hypothetical protein
MSDDDIKQLEKEVRKLKRVAQEWASQLHDLVEDRLPAGYAELPAITQSTFEACKAWEEASERLLKAQASA